MLGAIIGDLAGSIYEFDQFKKVKRFKVKNLIEDNAFFSDDTILTVAIADAILSGESYEEKLKEYGGKYMHAIPKGQPYFENMFSPRFADWVNGDYVGESAGNGCMMRVSPVGNLFDSEEEVLENARLATIPSHNAVEAISCAQTIAIIIFYLRKGVSKKDIIKKLGLKIKKPKLKTFNYSASETIGLCLYAFFRSKNFEDAIKKTISFGGDTDTNACIVGSMAEVAYGVPEELKQQALAKLPNKFLSVIKKFEKKQIKIKG